MTVPRWLIRALNAIGVAVAIVIAAGLVRAPAVKPPAGFSGDVSQAPRIGVWRAVGTYTSIKGHLGRSEGEQITRAPDDGAALLTRGVRVLHHP